MHGKLSADGEFMETVLASFEYRVVMSSDNLRTIVTVCKRKPASRSRGVVRNRLQVWTRNAACDDFVLQFDVPARYIQEGLDKCS